jgi:hypothetical protein
LLSRLAVVAVLQALNRSAVTAGMAVDAMGRHHLSPVVPYLAVLQEGTLLLLPLAAVEAGLERLVVPVQELSLVTAALALHLRYRLVHL